VTQEWQIVAVVLIQLAAVIFLVSRFWPRRGPRTSKRPDVPVSSLTRKKKSDCH
jgi:hypothetical protein